MCEVMGFTCMLGYFFWINSEGRHDNWGRITEFWGGICDNMGKYENIWEKSGVVSLEFYNFIPWNEESPRIMTERIQTLTYQSYYTLWQTNNMMMNRLHITISMITIMQVLIMNQVMCKLGLILMADSKLFSW